MGRAIKHTNVKVDGAAGPLGKGVPLSKAAGPGGIAKPGMEQGSQIPGFKELMAKKMAAMKNSKSRLFRGMTLGNTGDKGAFYDKLKQRMGQQRRGGLFSRAFDQMGKKPGRGLFGGGGKLVPPGQTVGGGVTELAPKPIGGMKDAPILKNSTTLGV